MARKQEIRNKKNSGETLYIYFIRLIRVESIFVTSKIRDHILFLDKLVHFNVKFYVNHNYQTMYKISMYYFSSCIIFCNIIVSFNDKLFVIHFIQMNSSAILYIFFSIFDNCAILVIIFISHLYTNYRNKSLFEMNNLDKLVIVLTYSNISYHFIIYITLCTILVIILVSFIMIYPLHKALFIMKYLVINYNPSKSTISLYNLLIFIINLLDIVTFIVSASQLILYTSQTLYYVFTCQYKDLFANSLNSKSSSHGKITIYVKIILRYGNKLNIYITTFNYNE